VFGLTPNTAYQFELVSFRGTLNLNATFGALSNVASGTTTLTAATTPAPGTVSNLSVVSTADTAATLTFTQVTDGAGGAASYDVRYAVSPLTWATATHATRGTCTTPVAGTTVGSALTCTVLGLTANTAYQFQVVAFRGTLNVNAVLGALSNVASATTARTAVASVAVTPLTGTVAVGSTMPFTATPKDIHNNPVSGWPVAWSSSSPTIATVGSTTGMVTGVAAGAATITATIGGQSGTAAATVSPVSTGGSYPNQPAGYTRIAETNDAALPWANLLSGSIGNAGAKPGTLETIVSGASLPVTFPNQTSALKHIIEAGTPPGYEEAGSDWAEWWLWQNEGTSSQGGPGADEFSAFYQSTYFSVYGNGSTFEGHAKMLGYWGVGNNNQNLTGGGPTQLFTMFEPVSPTGGNPYTVTDLTIDMASQIIPGQKYFTQNLNLSKHVVVGQVHHFEQVLTLGTPGNADGTWDWWLDGVHIGHYTNVPFINAAWAAQGGNGTAGFFGWQFSPWWQGGGSANSTRDNVLYLGHTYLSGIFLRSRQ
jgi:hypothetical protein